MLAQPIYDPNKSFEENFDEGPFGPFTDGQVFKDEGEPKYEFLGQKVHSTFGIAAGPLPNSRFCKVAFEKGFDLCVYKTVRGDVYPCNPWPNILSVKVEGDLTMEKVAGKVVVDRNFTEPLSITNSFGVPSKGVSFWQEDVKRAMTYAGVGQVLILGFMGTVREGQTEDEFINDFAITAKYAMETGVKILEVNLSCPNVGNEKMVCYDLVMTEKICRAIREVIGKTPLILKVGYYQNYEDIQKLGQIVQKYAEAVAAINTISAEIVNEKGEQALPGKNRVRSGVCGASIKWAGLEMTRNLKKVREEIGADYKIVGMGGVMSKADYSEYVEAGADAVMSVTGAMWNSMLAQEIKKG